MKKVISCCCFLMICITGCGNAEKQKIPDKIKEKLISSAESVTVDFSEQDVSPEKVWDTILINGEHVTLPFCINDIGEGFEITDVDQNKNVLIGKLKYYGKNVAVFGGKSSKDEVKDNPLASIYFVGNDLEEIGKNIWPISINGVTIGSYVDDVRKKLPFFQEEYDDYYYRFSYENDEYKVKVLIADKQVDEIDLNIKSD